MPRRSSVKYSFTAGEIAEHFYGRTDVERYDLAAKVLHNAPPHYGGGAFKRRGTQHVTTAVDARRLIPFQFGDASADAYVIVMYDEDFRIISSLSKSFVLDGIDPLEIAHPYAPADFRQIKYEQVFDQVRLTHPNYPTHILTRTDAGWEFDEEELGGGSPLLSGGVPVMPNAVQSTSFVRSIAVKNGGSSYATGTTVDVTGGGGKGFQATLTIQSGVITAVNISDPGVGFTSAPTVVLDDEGGGTGATFEVNLAPEVAGFTYTVSANYANGAESGIMRPRVVRAHLDFTQFRGSAKLSWPAVPDAVSYNIYRSLVYPDGDDVHAGLPLGYVGTTQGTEFVDNNIVPDFTRTPRRFSDPFALGAVENVTITNQGSAYEDDDTFSISGGDGTGFIGWPIVKDGKILGVYVADPGEGYTTGTATFGTSTGVDAAATLSFAEQEGNYPAVSFTFQQRSGYGGAPNNPMMVRASRARYLTDFSHREIVTPDDPYEKTIDSPRASQIRHALVAELGLLLFTTSNIALLRAPEGQSVTELQGTLDQQSFVGASHAVPQSVENNIVYVAANHRSMQMLLLEPAVRRYQPRELSLLSTHFFDGREVVAMASAVAEKMVYGIYSTGTGFIVTVDAPQEVFGFASFSTKGKFLDTVALNLSTGDEVYFLVERIIDGVATRLVEVILPEVTDAPEDAIYLDGCVSIEKIFPAANVTPSGTTGTITLEADAAVFAAEDVGKIVWVGKGRGFITEFTSDTEVTVNLTRAITDLAFESSEAAIAAEGEWWMNPPLFSVSGIPYEGTTVAILGDGKEQADKVVASGEITLDQTAAIVRVGFPYRTVIELLPLVDPQSPLEGRLRSISEAYIRVARAGPFTAGGFSVVRRGSEPWSEPTRLYQGGRTIFLNGGWDKDGTIRFESDSALPLELLQVAVFFDVSG